MGDEFEGGFRVASSGKLSFAFNTPAQPRDELGRYASYDSEPWAKPVSGRKPVAVPVEDVAEDVSLLDSYVARVKPSKKFRTAVEKEKDPHADMPRAPMSSLEEVIGLPKVRYTPRETGPSQDLLG